MKIFQGKENNANQNFGGSKKYKDYLEKTQQAVAYVRTADKNDKEFKKTQPYFEEKRKRIDNYMLQRADTIKCGVVMYSTFGLMGLHKQPQQAHWLIA